MSPWTEAGQLKEIFKNLAGTGQRMNKSFKVLCSVLEKQSKEKLSPGADFINH